MGMFNEVYKNCYNCGARCTIQIPQIVLGFGGFDLDNTHTTEELTYEQKLKLKEYAEKENFYCDHNYCNSTFEVEINVLPEYSGKTIVNI